MYSVSAFSCPQWSSRMWDVRPPTSLIVQHIIQTHDSSIKSRKKISTLTKVNFFLSYAHLKVLLFSSMYSVSAFSCPQWSSRMWDVRPPPSLMVQRTIHVHTHDSNIKSRKKISTLTKVNFFLSYAHIKVLCSATASLCQPSHVSKCPPGCGMWGHCSHGAMYHPYSTSNIFSCSSLSSTWQIALQG